MLHAAQHMGPTKLTTELQHEIEQAHLRIMDLETTLAATEKEKSRTAHQSPPRRGAGRDLGRPIRSGQLHLGVRGTEAVWIGACVLCQLTNCLLFRLLGRLLDASPSVFAICKFPLGSPPCVLGLPWVVG